MTPKKKPSQKKQTQKVEDLLLNQPTSFKTWYLQEPLLEFGSNGQCADPKTGIALYGPWSDQDDSAKRNVRIGIIGTGHTISEAQNWLARCRGAVTPSKAGVDPILFPDFPGMEASTGFDCKLEFPSRLQEVLSPADISKCVSAPSKDHAIDEIMIAIRQRLETLSEKDSPPDVVVVALPNEVKEVAGAGRSPTKFQKASPPKEIPAQLSFFDLPLPAPPTPAISKTLHRAIKAEGMRTNIPTQLAWPAAFTGSSGVQDDATRAWNFCTALYYKAGGIPWRVSGLSKDTCYIGITFFRPSGSANLLQTSMAQAFSDRGDGIVLRGESFEWDSKTQGEPHLTLDSAKSLVAGVIEQYKKHRRQAPARVVVHKSSSFSADEIAGIEQALAGIQLFDLLTIGRSQVRFLRTGSEPPVRGTVIQIAEKRYVCYTGGYVPFLKVYPGLRIPSPLVVTHHKGSGSVQEFLGEILALTKLNWNSAAFATASPITIDFSNNVGLILSELPFDIEPQRFHRFYM